VVLSRKSVEYIRKNKRQTQIRFLQRSLWEKEEKRTKRREKLVESCNHQSKVRVGLILSNLKYCNSEIEFGM